ncbi:MAG: DNA-processing protein DprA [Planctomycetota bacterium]|nr:DNA-processing protein DprA [Planctomycetota bacterium]
MNLDEEEQVRFDLMLSILLVTVQGRIFLTFNPAESERKAMENLVDLVTLNMTIGVGSVIYRRLLEFFETPSAILDASERDLQQVQGVSGKLSASIKSMSRSMGEDEIAFAESLSVGIITQESPQYPQSLLSIHDPPIVLYVRGECKEQDALAIGIVGSRRCSHYGRIQAERFGSDLARMGFTIISGLAQGIDTSAHQGALKVKGRTIAVLGNGLSHVYPTQNAQLAQEVADNGAVISEFPMKTRVDARHFPQRNRLISGLSLGVMVVEASKQSGTLITANFALEQGREVFALPGRVDNPTSSGTHMLIQQGAKLVTSPADVVDELGPLANVIQPLGEEAVTDPRALTLNSRERQIYETLSHDPLQVDDIIRMTGIPAPNVLSTLTILEVRRLVKQLAGKRFVKA